MMKTKARSIAWMAIGCMAVGLFAGCGTDANSTRHKVEAILVQYNSSRPRDLGGTGRACRQAADQLQAAGAANAYASLPKSQKNRAYALDQVVRLALSGFGDCAVAAPRLDFVRMVRAVQEIDQANTWIDTARAAKS